MKLFKKLSTLLAAAAMMLITVTTTNAAGETTNQNLTIKKVGSTFNTYQVLNATKEENKVFSFKVSSEFEAFFKGDSNYGGYTFNPDKGILKDGKVVVKTDGINESIESPSKVTPSDEMADITYNLQKYIAEKNLENKAQDFNNGIDLPAGYYLVVEASHKKVDGKVYVPSKAMLVNLTKNVTMYPKDDEFTVTKKVKADGADHDTNNAGIGDKIEYNVTVPLPKFDANQTGIDLKLTDVLTGGLVFNKDLAVKVGNDDLSNSKDYIVTYSDDLKTMTVTFDKSDKLLAGSKVGSSLTLTYSATVTKDALIIGGEGNKNDVKLEFNNEEIHDFTKTYVYGFDILKKGLDGADADTPAEFPKGAEFELYREGESAPVELTDAEGNKYTTIVTDDKGLAKVEGIKAGTYILKETKAPEGYAKLQGDIKINIIADMVDEEYTGTYHVTASANGNDGSLDVVTSEDKTVTVTNYKGISLPETGGMGTTVFMIGGAALVVLAGALLIVYSKKSKKA